MPDNNKLTLAERLAQTKGQTVTGLSRTADGSGIKINTNAGVPKLHQRLGQARNLQSQVDPATLPNRIVIMCDLSGSMASPDDWQDDSAKTKIELLKDALQGFFSAMNPVDTAVGLEFFPWRESIRLSTDTVLLQMLVMGLEASGGTPLARCLEVSINHPLTRGIIISDGDADSHYAAEEAARQFANAEIPIDCVHIGSSCGGEALLRKIAEMTKGIYIKWESVGNFAEKFSFLTPQNRARLMLPGAAALLGAKEVK